MESLSNQSHTLPALHCRIIVSGYDVQPWPHNSAIPNIPSPGIHLEGLLFLDISKSPSPRAVWSDHRIGQALNQNSLFSSYWLNNKPWPIVFSVRYDCTLIL